MQRPYRDNPFLGADGRDDSLPTRQQDGSNTVIPLHQEPNIPTGAAPPSGYSRLAPYPNPFNAESSDNLLNPGSGDPAVAGTGARAGATAATAATNNTGYRPSNLTAEALWKSEQAPITGYEMRNMSDHRYNAWGQPKSSRKKWLVAIFVVILGSLALGGAIAGIVLGTRKSNRSSSSSISSSDGASKVSQTNPNDPSQFSKDPNLHQSLYGLAYTPTGSLLPECGNSLAEVIHDIQIMSQLTKRVRLYGADCNQSALVLEAIKQTKVDMQVFLGNYPMATDNGVAYRRQRDAIKAAIQTYGTTHIGGVTVGNEFMLNYLSANSATDPNSSTGDRGAEILIADIKDTRTMLSELGVQLAVGTSDAGAYFNNKVLAEVDYGLANVHPWFANVTVQHSAAWTATFFQDVNVAQANTLSNRPKMYIAETGWPTASSDLANANNGASAASEANLQIFMDTFLCQANTNGTGYFFFEYCDEPWKDKQFGGVEGWWGLLTANRTLKNVNIPNCPVS